jgi:putative acetyltransferase
MFVIRRARQEDNEAIRRVHIRAVREIAKSHYTQEEIEAWAVPRKLEHYESSIREKEFYVAEENSEVVGFGTLNQETCEVEAVYVSPETARRGVGSEILRTLEERARDLGLKELHLDASLNAVSFYESAGFVRQQEAKHRLQTGVEIGCVLMSKRL